jgi:hypothetical protein
VPDPPIGIDILDGLNNTITVGKVEIAVPANKYDFVALPFSEDGYLLSNIIGEQLGDGGEYYFWDKNSQTNPGASYSSAGGWTGNDKGLLTPQRLGDGFYVRAKSAVPLALVGRFGKLTTPYNKPLVPKNKYNLIANSFPQANALSGMGIVLGAGEAGADVYEWVNYSAYKGSTYTGSAWTVSGINSLQLARPRFYRPISQLTWAVDPQEGN